MFGIGLPELILILAVALIVVGPEKLPELAKSLGKGIVELKKAAASLKDSLNEGENSPAPWSDQDAETHPNKLLEAYKDLPENAMADRFEPAFPDGAVTNSEPTAGTEEIGRDIPVEPEEEPPGKKKET